ncbi:MAG: aminotransferase class V-fold PLP-dependent enzyme [Oscillospiraceae bacterium]|nr:aminotransferase class V-fold PLP-dependent enzyme [Oscillospiraceae bacterium]
MPQYLDYNASTPLDKDVFQYMMSVYSDSVGNADSRTHLHGAKARDIVESARTSLANLLKVDSSELVFTSGATESSNTAILGLAEWGKKNGRTHVITTAIEHKAILESFRQLEMQGFTSEYILPKPNGVIDCDELISKVSEKTLLVSIQHVNNETGAIQPIKQIGDYCRSKNVFIHVDAAQSCGKLVDDLQNAQYDFLSATAHKMYGPQGVGILVLRRKNHIPPPIAPHSFGGGQESNIRSGTLPVSLIAGFGKAAELALFHHHDWNKHNSAIKESVLRALNETKLNYVINGDVDVCIGNTLNISFLGVNSEALMIAARPYFSLANGSACTSKEYRYSHVLEAMGVTNEVAESSIRISWGKDIHSIDTWKLAEIVKNIIE